MPDTSADPTVPPSHPRLPAGFRFGASTAAYQVEGAVHEGGRGASVWDTFCAEPGRIVDGSSGGGGWRAATSTATPRTSP